MRFRRKLAVADLDRERWALMNRPVSVLEAFRRVTMKAGLESPVVTVEAGLVHRPELLPPAIELLAEEIRSASDRLAQAASPAVAALGMLGR